MGLLFGPVGEFHVGRRQSSASVRAPDLGIEFLADECLARRVAAPKIPLSGGSSAGLGSFGTKSATE